MLLQAVSLLSISEIFGDFALKRYADSGGLSNLGYGILGYIGVVFFLIQSLRGNSIIVVKASWDGISALIEYIVAYLILGERLSDPNQYIGIGLIVCGMFFLKIPVH
jgi:multidrug transporter EmrE-like cation transporter